jgi:uncharacterized protein DUF1353
MTQFAQRMFMRRLVAKKIFIVSVACFSALFASPSPPQVKKKDKTELSERYDFMKRAMAEQDEQTKKRLDELAKRGISPLLIVSSVVPFADWDFYFVKEGPISWRPNTGDTPQQVVVPEGFVSDLASIPRIFWQILRPTGRYAYAAIVHDYLYWTQARSREEADEIFRIAMEDSKVEAATVRTLYEAVRQFGQAAWDENARLRKTGECRVLKRLPADFTISWTEWKKRPDVFSADCNK